MKKILSILLTVAMLACMLPMAVSAEEITEGEIPFAKKTDGTVLSGVTAELENPNQNKRWNLEEGKMYPGAGTNGCIFVFNDTMKSGRLEATVSRSADHKNCDGIIFGLSDNDVMNFWESGVSYYYLFIDENMNLRLSKTGDGIGWLEGPGCNVPTGLANMADGVTIAAEWDGEGNVKCYLNGELKFEYADSGVIPNGSRYGVRAQTDSTTYTSIVAGYPVEEDGGNTDVDTPPQTGDMTVLAVAVATVALIGTGVIVSKKRRFN